MARTPLLFWAGEWNTWPIPLFLSVVPQPLCTDCVGKGCNYSCNGCYLQCLLGYGLIKPYRRHTWYVNDGPLGFALVFHTPLVFPCFLPTSPVLSSSGPIPSLFFFFLFLGVLVFCFLLDFHLTI